MKLPALSHVPPCISRRDLRRSLEAMRAGLDSDPPDAFVVDWEETMTEVERLLTEVDDEARDLP